MSKPSLPSFLFGKRSTKSRRGISPVIATTIILAITIVLGLALWSFANSGVGTATVKYSEAVNEYGEIVRHHRYVIANVDFNNPNPPANQVSFWIYNNGKLNTTISADHVLLTCDLCASSYNPDGLVQDSPDDPSNPLTVFPKSFKKFHFNAGAALESGKAYELTVVSDEGLTQTYVKSD